jgi:hypothetical protein
VRFQSIGISKPEVYGVFKMGETSDTVGKVIDPMWNQDIVTEMAMLTGNANQGKAEKS